MGSQYLFPCKTPAVTRTRKNGNLLYFCTMQTAPLYTIGHSSREAATFLALLQASGIDYLVDVRTYPYSRFHPQYNRKTLSELLEKNGIRYVFMGDALGGRPQDPSCYTATGKVSYALIREKAVFVQGIARLRTAIEKDLRVAIMCSEGKPEECHRTHLVANVLYQEGINILHIDEKGVLRDHLSILKRIPGKTDLFNG